MSDSKQTTSRRKFFVGAGAAGAAAAVAVVTQRVAEPVEHAQTPRAKPEKGGGYSLTEHVKHYYRTTLV